MILPKISLITPSFNQAGYIEETIQSVIGQYYSNLQYLIIDGGSTDGSVGIIEKYKKRLHYFCSEPDSGMYDALQKGFEKCTGDIMGWINSDDMLHPGALDAVAEIFSSFPQVEWIQGMPSFFDERGRIVQTGPFKRWSAYHFYLGDFRWIQQESTFWRRNLWERAGGYIDKTLRYAGDFDLWLRFFKYSPLFSTTALLGGFRLRQSGQLSQKHLKEYLEEAAVLLEKERKSLPLDKQKRLIRLQSKFRAYKTLKKIHILNSDRFYSQSILPDLNLAPIIAFDRASQSFFMKQENGKN